MFRNYFFFFEKTGLTNFAFLGVIIHKLGGWELLGTPVVILVSFLTETRLTHKYSFFTEPRKTNDNPRKSCRDDPRDDRPSYRRDDKDDQGRNGRGNHDKPPNARGSDWLCPFAPCGHRNYIIHRWCSKCGVPRPQYFTPGQYANRFIGGRGARGRGRRDSNFGKGIYFFICLVSIDCKVKEIANYVRTDLFSAQVF